MKQYIFVLTLLILLTGCEGKLKIINIPNYQYQTKIEDLKQYKITSKQNIASFLGLDVNSKNFKEISKRIKPSKLKKGKDLCQEFQRALPQLWDKISSNYKIPNKWEKDSLSLCKSTNGLIDSVQVKVLSNWSSQITRKDEINSPYLNKVRNINLNNSPVKVYKFRIASVITAKLNYDSKGEISSIFFAIDCDFYLNYLTSGDGSEAISKWLPIPEDNLDYKTMKLVIKDMQSIILSEYLKTN